MHRCEDTELRLCLEVVELQGDIQFHIRIPNSCCWRFGMQLGLHSVTRHGRQQRPDQRRTIERYFKQMV